MTPGMQPPTRTLALRLAVARFAPGMGSGDVDLLQRSGAGAFPAVFHVNLLAPLRRADSQACVVTEDCLRNPFHQDLVFDCRNRCACYERVPRGRLKVSARVRDCRKPLPKRP